MNALQVAIKLGSRAEKKSSRTSRLRTLAICSVVLAASAFAKTSKNSTLVFHPSSFAVSQPVSELPDDFDLIQPYEMPEPHANPNRVAHPWTAADPVLQKQPLGPLAATKGIDFDGIGATGFSPSDANMAIGPNHIVETVNIQFAIYDKTGAVVKNPTNIKNLFTPLGGLCNASLGDPVVLYDRAADRWLISMIGGGSTSAECVAVSKTSDPTGAYFLYSYSFGNNLNDYPKLGIWATATNSAYLASYDILQNGVTFIGSDLCGFDRAKMLAGNATAAQLCQMTPKSEFSYLPSDMDGPIPPAEGTPGLFIQPQGGTKLYLRKLTLDFASGTATLSGAKVIPVAAYTEAPHGAYVPQSATTQLLDSLGDLTMYRFAVRHFADHDRAVLNHSVLNGTQVAVRWYELYDPAGVVTLNQQGTFAPDSTHRWMGSAAEDQAGNIAVGYSASSSDIHPAIRFAGRVPSDPLGSLESEISMIEGAGSQSTGVSRWGDYSALQVDPVDDCTFWYVAQYEQATGTSNWHTRIGSFTFDTCPGTPDFDLTASPTSLTIAVGKSGNSTITVIPFAGFTDSVTLDASGLPDGVTATFNPNPATTTSTLTLTAASTATLGTATITITGTSGALSHQVSLQLAVVNAPIVTLTPSSLTWGKVLVGLTKGPKTVTVSNSGSQPLNFSDIAISGDFALATVTKSCATGKPVAPGKTCQLKVTFTPTQTGSRTGAVTLTDDAPDTPQSIPLQGTGK